MLRVIQFLIFGHFHKWATIQEGNFYENNAAQSRGASPIGRVYYQQCEHCGKVIRRRLI